MTLTALVLLSGVEVQTSAVAEWYVERVEGLGWLSRSIWGLFLLWMMALIWRAFYVRIESGDTLESIKRMDDENIKSFWVRCEYEKWLVFCGKVLDLICFFFFFQFLEEESSKMQGLRSCSCAYLVLKIARVHSRMNLDCGWIFNNRP